MNALAVVMKWFPVAIALTSTAATLALCGFAVALNSPVLSLTAAVSGVASGACWMMCD